MTGLWTEVCVTWPTIEMLGAGYNVYVVDDCCGATSQAAHDAALSRMVQAGAVRLTTIAALLGAATEGLNEEEAAEQAIVAVEQLRRRIGIPARIRDLGGKREQLALFAEKAFVLKRLLWVNPRRATQADLLGILEDAF